MSSAASSLAQVTRSMHCASSSHVAKQSVCTPRCVHRDLVYPSVHLQRRLPGFSRRPLSPPMSVPGVHLGEDRFEAGDVEGTEASNHSSFLTSALLLGTTFLLLTTNSAEAMSDPGPHYHPVAADLNILAQNVCSIPIYSCLGVILEVISCVQYMLSWAVPFIMRFTAGKRRCLDFRWSIHVLKSDNTDTCVHKAFLCDSTVACTD